MPIASRSLVLTSLTVYTDQFHNSCPASYHSAEFQRLIFSNDPPNDASEYLADRSLLRKQLEGRLDAEEKRSLKHILDDYDTVLHPIRIVPVEILTQIFLLASDPDLFGWQNFQCQPHPCWALSRVSRRWREVVLNSPVYWSNIRIFIPRGTADSNRRDSNNAALVDVQLQRASTCPLNISISGPVELSPLLLSVLVPSSNRWKQLSIDVPPLDFSRLLGIKGQLASLERLYIRIPFTQGRLPEYIWRLPLKTLFETAPNLTVVCGDAAPLNSCIFPRQQVKQYHEIVPVEQYYKGYDNIAPIPHRVLGHLPEMTALQYCHLKLGLRDRPPWAGVVCSLPNLLQLGVSGPVPLLSLVLPLFVVPKLTHLSLEMLQDDLSISGDVFHSIREGFSSVRHLAITPGVASSEAFFMFLETRAELETLYCELDKMTFLNSFVDKFSTPAFLPKLTMFYSGFHSTTDKVKQCYIKDFAGRIRLMKPDVMLRLDLNLSSYCESQGFFEENGMEYGRWKGL